jgi:hypothetical protein
MLLAALCVPSVALAATAKYQVPSVSPLISALELAAPLTTSDLLIELSEVP